MARTKQVALKEREAKTQKRQHAKPAKMAALEPAAPKRHKWRSGTVALRDVRKIQNRTDNMIPKAAFDRLVRDELDGKRISAGAMEALQTAAEDILTSMFNDIMLNAIHAGRTTVMKVDSDRSKSSHNRFTLLSGVVYPCVEDANKHTLPPVQRAPRKAAPAPEPEAEEIAIEE